MDGCSAWPDADRPAGKRLFAALPGLDGGAALAAMAVPLLGSCMTTGDRAAHCRLRRWHGCCVAAAAGHLHCTGGDTPPAVPGGGAGGGGGAGDVADLCGLSAPDLALTQLSVEVVSTVLLLMGLALLPANVARESANPPQA
jgi:hypothetical protein